MAALAAALLVGSAHADTFGSGANQFSIDFVNIGYAGNVANYVEYAEYTGVSGFTDGLAAPLAGYGAVNYNYSIGKYEITIDQFTKADAASGNVIGDGNENHWNDGTRNVGSDAPASIVSWQEAARFANWLTSGDINTGIYSFSGDVLTGINRSYRNTNNLAYALPSEDEWYKAAYYKPINDGTYSLYSSGLNTGPNTNGWNYSELIHNPRPGVMWETGDGSEEQNGTYDMMGNVWEWTETILSDDVSVVYRGGSAYGDTNFLDSSTIRTSHTMADGGTYHVGFRIAAIPEPGSLAMVVLVGSGIWGIRRFFRV